jgi:chemotaxis protein MotB
MHYQGFATRTRVALAVSSFLFASCVTQEKYDESVALADKYELQMHSAQERAAKLQEENDRLRAQLLGDQASALSDASWGQSMRDQVGELRRMIDDLDHPPGDIERFDVEGGYVFMIQDKVLFESGSADIGSDGRAALLKLSAEIRNAPHGRIVVRGHTDSDPVVKPATMERFPHGNLQLSAARAVSVGALLIAEGKVDARDVVVAGYGPWEPVADNDSADNKRLNRRVEIFVADA